jgi:uncharacterized lipoprotein YddW (UPF0748 family)
MNIMFRILFATFSLFFLLLQNILAQTIPRRELRAVWIATVDNIDFPENPGMTPLQQKESFTKLLDMHQANGMNAVVVQIRPATDAFYPSPLEPWSQWLTGVQGKSPVPYYDPLQFMIEETHRRKMEFHAWMNPYRAVFNINTSTLSATHITRIHPEWFLIYGDKKYFDPGNKEAQKYVTAVVKDVVTRYDADAVHFDDYFYPYRIGGKEFPDTLAFARYGNGMKIDDWRRSNTDSIILMLSKAIKQTSSDCQFGISPFGVWRNADKDPRGSNTRAGQTNYDDLYADILLWLKLGWIDYVAPQLYWEIGHNLAEYNTLVDWWSHNSFGKNCYVGLGIYRAGSNAAWKDKTQLPRQIEKLRNTPNIKNPNGWCDSLRLNYFREPALPPQPR